MANPICSNPTNFNSIISEPLLKKLNESSVSEEELAAHLGSGNLVNDDQLIHIDSNVECPANLNGVPNSNEATAVERNICPSYKVISRDALRYPEYITEVRCKCKNCMEHTGQSVENTCERMYEHMIVFERTECVNGVWQYVPRDYPRQIGCFCARRKEVQNGSGSQATTSTPLPPQDSADEGPL